jgi:glyoxylase-like metal-dependent hydrolase (beta-lactamase superfamily II)
MRSWTTGTQEAAPGVFAYVQATGGFCIANAGIIAGGDSTTVIDALFAPSMTRALLDETRRVSGAPIARLINTHHHVDHTLGNALFPESAEVLTHERAKAEMQRVGMGVLPLIARMAPQFAGELQEVSGERLPDTTFSGDSFEIAIGHRRARLLHFGTGHTRGDVLVHLPDERILFAGDVAFFYVTPMAFEGHVGKWIDVCERVLAMPDADVIVPGHGPPGGKDELREFAGYLRLVHGHARAAFAAGADEEEAAATLDLGQYAEWGEPERLRLNVNRVYQELRGEISD